MSNEGVPRSVAGVSELKALTHPVRVALLDALALQPTLTATEAGRLIGETATTCSFHLRQLERFGFVERAGEDGRREKPWRLAGVALQVPLNAGGDQGTAVRALRDVMLAKHLNHFRQWDEESGSWEAEWRESVDQSQYVLWVTAEEFADTVAALRGLLSKYRSRLADPESRPSGARAVQILTLAHPFARADPDS